MSKLGQAVLNLDADDTALLASLGDAKRSAERILTGTDATVKIGANDDKLQTGLRSSRRGAKQAVSEIEAESARGASALGGIRKAALGLGGIVAGAFVLSNVRNWAAELIGAARESERVGRQTDAVIKSTQGVAKVSAENVKSLATSLSDLVGVDDDLIAGGENMLLTFTNIRNEVGKNNDIFNQASGLALDMASAFGQGEITAQGLQTSVVQLGKALNDPIKGYTALQRVGVTFTEEQKNQIRTLQESGDMLGAQKIILAELGREFGGSAAAVATGAARMRVAIGNVQEALGGALIPSIEKASGALADFLAKPETQQNIQRFADMLSKDLVRGVEWLIQHGPDIKEFASGFADGFRTILNVGGQVVDLLGKVGSFLNDQIGPGEGERIGREYRYIGEGLAVLTAATVAYKGTRKGIDIAGDLKGDVATLAGLGVGLKTAAAGISVAGAAAVATGAALVAAAGIVSKIQHDKTTQNLREQGEAAGLTAEQVKDLTGQYDKLFGISFLNINGGSPLDKLMGGSDRSLENLTFINKHIEIIGQAARLSGEQIRWLKDNWELGIPTLDRVAAAMMTSKDALNEFGGVAATGVEKQKALGTATRTTADEFMNLKIAQQAAMEARHDAGSLDILKDMKIAANEASGAILEMDQDLQNIGSRRNYWKGLADTIKTEMDRITEAGNKPPAEMVKAYNLAMTQVNLAMQGAARKATDIVGSINSQTSQFLDKTHRMWSGRKQLIVDVEGNTADIDAKLRFLEGKRLDPKTGLLYANDQDYRRKMNALKDLKVNTKTGQIEAWDKYTETWRKVQGYRVDTKTGQIKADASEYWAELERIKRGGAGFKTFVDVKMRQADSSTGVPGRASGGHVSAGELYRVNEGFGQVEYFRPSMGGYVLPLAPSGGAGGSRMGGDQNTFNIYTDRPVGHEVDRVLRRREMESRLAGASGGTL